MLLSKIADYNHSIKYDYFVFTDEGRLQIDIVNYRPYDRTDGLIYRKHNSGMIKKRKAHVLSQLNGKSLAVNYRKTVEQIEAELLACHSHRRYEYITSTLFLLLLESDSPITSVIDFKEGYTTYTRKGKEWRIDHSWQLEELLDEFLVNRTFGSRFLEKLLTLAKEVPTTSNFQPSESYKRLIGAIRMSRNEAFEMKHSATDTEAYMLPYFVLNADEQLCTAVSYSDTRAGSVSQLGYLAVEAVDLGTNRELDKLTELATEDDATAHKRSNNAMQPTKTGRNTSAYTVASDLFGTFTFSNSIRSEADHDVETATPIYRNGSYYLSWHATAAILQSGLIESMYQADLILLLLQLKHTYDTQGYIPYLKHLRSATGTCIY